MEQNNFLGKLLSQLNSTLAVICLMLVSLGNAQADKVPGFEALKSGNHFAIMRHAIAPGFGDPANFELRVCSTQRNLSQGGIEQAKRIGDRFRENGITEAKVYTSQWCRCIDTAKHLNLGKAEELPTMNSFFETQERGEMQNQQLKEWLAEQDLSKPLVLVAHQVNITALAGVYPASGEIIVVERTAAGELEVTDRIQTE